MTKKQNSILPQNGKAVKGHSPIAATPIAPKTPKVKPTHNEVALKAYELYQLECCPHGRDTAHWLLAEIQLSI